MQKKFQNFVRLVDNTDHERGQSFSGLSIYSTQILVDLKLIYLLE